MTLATLLSVFLVLVSTYGFAESMQNDYIACETTFVAPEQISISEQGIFIRFGDLYIETPAVFFDGRSLSFSTYRIVDEWRYWKCPRCGYGTNEFFDKTCRNCGYRPGIDKP